jgi:hypothetical protein
VFPEIPPGKNGDQLPKVCSLCLRIGVQLSKVCPLCLRIDQASGCFGRWA